MKKNKSKNNQSGQAIMELLVLLIAFMVCFVGLLTVMGLSIANIEIFTDAKFDAEQNAIFSDYGNDGHEIYSWHYTPYGDNEVRIPFLPGDKPVAASGTMENFHAEFNNPVYSNLNTEYKFNDFSVIQTDVENFGSNTPFLSYLAANLREGRTGNFNSGENIVLVSDRRYFARQKTYDAFEKILGVSLEKINLEDSRTNKVFFPAMQIKK